MMFIFLCYFFSFFTYPIASHTERVEIYDFWRPNAIGEDAFKSDHFYQLIRLKLEEVGLSVRNWDRKAHQPFLKKSRKFWRSRKSLKRFCFSAFSKKELLDKDTVFLILSGIGPHLRPLNLKLLPKKKMILFIWEPPTVEDDGYQSSCRNLFSKVYTWNDTLVDGENFSKFYLPFLTSRIPDLVPYEKRRFLTLIASNLVSTHPHERYSERRKIISYFEERPDIQFDLYGRFWNSCMLRCWQGEIPNKMDVLKQYRFAIAYENSFEHGYITEKLWDCFAAGVVPIYWGAPNILDYVPEDCMILRERFQSDEELVSFLQAMSQEQWEGYVRKAEEFLKTDRARLFTPEHYAETIAQACQFRCGSR